MSTPEDFDALTLFYGMALRLDGRLDALSRVCAYLLARDCRNEPEVLRSLHEWFAGHVPARTSALEMEAPAAVQQAGIWAAVNVEELDRIFSQAEMLRQQTAADGDGKAKRH